MKTTPRSPRPTSLRKYPRLPYAVYLAICVIGGCSTRSPDMAYSRLVAETKRGNVANVEFASDHAVVRLNQPPKGASSADEYRVTLPDTDQAAKELIDLLVEHDVPFQVTD